MATAVHVNALSFSSFLKRKQKQKTDTPPHSLRIICTGRAFLSLNKQTCRLISSQKRVTQVGMFFSVSAGNGLVIRKKRGPGSSMQWSLPCAISFGGGTNSLHATFVAIHS